MPFVKSQSHTVHGIAFGNIFKTMRRRGLLNHRMQLVRRKLMTKLVRDQGIALHRRLIFSRLGRIA